MLIYYQNSRGLASKFLSIYHLLRLVKPDLFILSETKTSPPFTLPLDAPTELSNYHLEYNGCSEGVCIGIKRSIAFTRLNSLEVPSHAPVICLSIPQQQSNPFPVVINGLYASPTAGQEKFFNASITCLQNIYSKFQGSDTSVLTFGDFNAHHTDWGSHTVNKFGVSLLQDLIIPHGIHNLNKIFAFGQPTRRPQKQNEEHTNSVIDLCLCSDLNTVSLLSVGCPIIPSDHNSIMCSIPTSVQARSIHHESWNMKHFNSHLFSFLLEKRLVEWQSTLDCFLADNPTLPNPAAICNIMTDHLIHIIHSTALEHIGKVQVVKEKRHWSQDNEEVDACLHRLNQEFQSQPKSSLREPLAHLTSALKKAREKSWQRLCTAMSDMVSGKLDWKKFRSVYQGPSSFTMPPLQRPDGSVCETLEDNLETLVEYFASVSSAPPPISSPKFAEVLSFKAKIVEHLGKDSTDFQVCRNKIRQMCTSLNISKSSGPDDIHPQFIKFGGEHLFKAITTLFNFCLRYAVVPDAFKIAHIVPFFKGDDNHPSQCKSYRPISLTAILAKLFEQTIDSFLDPIRQKISHFQAGFFKGRSQLFQMMRIRSAMLRTLANSAHNPVVFLDITKAFDTVWVDGLLFKVHGLGLPIHLVTLLYNFLTQRSIRVVHEGKMSSVRVLSSGVPQGCILSPLLFIVFIDDIQNGLHSFISIGLFADDIALWLRILSQDNIQIMNQALLLVAAWSKTWGLQFSPPKCRVLMCAKNPLAFPIPARASVVLNGHPIEQVNTFRYLGILFSEDCSWAAHISKLASSCGWMASHITRVARSGQMLPIHIFQLVKTHVLSRITYGWPVWSPHTQAEWLSLTRLLVSPIQRAFALCSTTSFDSLLSLAGIAPLQQLFHQRIVSFFNKLQQDPSPLYMEAFLDSCPDTIYYFPRKSWFQRSPASVLKFLLQSHYPDLPLRHNSLSSKLNLHALLPQLSDPPPVSPCFIARFAPTSLFSLFLRFACKNFYFTSEPPINVLCSTCPLCHENMPPHTTIYEHFLTSCYILTSQRQPIITMLAPLNIPTSFDVLTCKAQSPPIPQSIRRPLAQLILSLISTAHQLCSQH